MNMMQFKPFGAFYDTGHDTGCHEAVSSELNLGAGVGADDGDIMPQQMVPDLDVLASALVAAFRAHSHINNVMTHISGARWDDIERALHVILNSVAVPFGLSRLEANIIDLICAERGVTGRIFKPYFEMLLTRLLPPVQVAHLQAHILSLHEVAQMRDGRSGPAPGAIKTGVAR